MKTIFFFAAIALTFLVTRFFSQDPSTPRCGAPESPAPAWTDDGECAHRPCAPINWRRLGEWAPLVKGATLEASDLGPWCRITASWRIGEAPGELFEATFEASKGAIFPLPQGLVSLHFCLARTPDMAPTADLFLDPVTDAPALAPGDVFLPVEGEARLDADLHTSARLVRTNAPDAEPSVTIVHASRWFKNQGTDHPREFFGLHVGDTFPWDDLRATIVRVVVLAPPSRGWVEISIAPRGERARAQ